MAKKIEVPKTHNPGKGRPKERLAYLNDMEMRYLESFKGGPPFRGPKGVPSFAEDSASSKGVSRGDSSGTKGSVSGGGNKGPSGPSGPNSSPSRSSTSGGNSSRGAGSREGGGGGLNQGGQNNNSRGAGPSRGGATVKSTPSSPMSGQQSSFSTPSKASSYNRDVQIRDTLRSADTAKSIKSTPAVRNDGVTGFRAQALGVKSVADINGKNAAVKPTVLSGPMQGPLLNHPITRDIEVNRNIDRIKNDFYKNDFDYQMSVNRLQGGVQKAREASGLYGKSVTAQPRDQLSAPVRTAPSTGITKAERESLSPSGIAKSVGKSIAGFAGRVYSDPVGSAVSGVNALGNYMKDAYQTIAMAQDPRYANSPEVQRAAAEKAAEVAFNYGLGASGTSFLTKAVPENALGVFVAPNASKKLESVYDKARELSKRGATEEDVFNETAGMTDVGVSGLQKLPLPNADVWGFDVNAPLPVRQEFLNSEKNILNRAQDAVFGKMIHGEVPLSSVVDTSPLEGLYGGGLSNIPIRQSIMPVERDFWTKEGRSFTGSFSPVTEKIDINIPSSVGLYSRGPAFDPAEFSPTIVHEVGHAAAHLDTRPTLTKIPQGTNPNYEKGVIRRVLSDYGVSLPEKEIEDMANRAYRSNPGEILSRLSEALIGRPDVDMKDWGKRISNNPSEWGRVLTYQDLVRDAQRRAQNARRKSWANIRID